MGFFVRACVQALKESRRNAEIDGAAIVYRITTTSASRSAREGLVVPVCATATATARQIEKEIAASRPRPDGDSRSRHQGGTFTISNGGVYGSLMSTPSHAPRSGILGMTRSERPV